ncbi:porin [bacterium]|nr:porin [bacterium]
MKAAVQRCVLLLIALLPGRMYAQNGLYDYEPGEGITIGGGGYKANLGGYLQTGVQMNVYDTDSAFYTPARFRIRRLRLRLSGELASGKFEYRLNADLSRSTEVADQSSGYLLDAWLAYNMSRRWSITFGQRTTSTDSRSLRMGSQTLQFTERNRLISAFATVREFGLFVDGTVRLSERHYLRPSLAFTHGDGLSLQNFGGLKYGGRLDYLPFGLFNTFGQFRQVDLVRERTPKLVVGGYYSFNDGVTSRNGDAGGEILYLDEQGDPALPDYSKYGIDLLFKYQGVSLSAEWVMSTASVPNDLTQRVRTDGSVTSDFEINGVQDVENYVKNRMILGDGFNVQAGYIFPSGWSVDGRYTQLNADEFSFLNNTLFYDRPRYYTLGVGKFFDRNYSFRIQADYTWIATQPGARDLYGNEFTGDQGLATLLITYAF